MPQEQELPDMIYSPQECHHATRSLFLGERGQGRGRERERERESQAGSILSVEPDAGLEAMKR